MYNIGIVKEAQSFDGARELEGIQQMAKDM